MRNYRRDKVNDDAIENNADNLKIIYNKATTKRSIEYKTEIVGNTTVDNNILDTEVFVPLKDLEMSRFAFDLLRNRA